MRFILLIGIGVFAVLLRSARAQTGAPIPGYHPQGAPIPGALPFEEIEDWREEAAQPSHLPADSSQPPLEIEEAPTALPQEALLLPMIGPIEEPEDEPTPDHTGAAKTPPNPSAVKVLPPKAKESSAQNFNRELNQLRQKLTAARRQMAARFPREWRALQNECLNPGSNDSPKAEFSVRQTALKVLSALSPRPADDPVLKRNHDSELSFFVTSMTIMDEARGLGCPTQSAGLPPAQEPCVRANMAASAETIRNRARWRSENRKIFAAARRKAAKPVPPAWLKPSSPADEALANKQYSVWNANDERMACRMVGSIKDRKKDGFKNCYEPSDADIALAAYIDLGKPCYKGIGPKIYDYVARWQYQATIKSGKGEKWILEWPKMAAKKVEVCPPPENFKQRQVTINRASVFSNKLANDFIERPLTERLL